MADCLPDLETGPKGRRGVGFPLPPIEAEKPSSSVPDLVLAKKKGVGFVGMDVKDAVVEEKGPNKKDVGFVATDNENEEEIKSKNEEVGFASMDEEEQEVKPKKKGVEFSAIENEETAGDEKEPGKKKKKKKKGVGFAASFANEPIEEKKVEESNSGSKNPRNMRIITSSAYDPIIDRESITIDGGGATRNSPRSGIPFRQARHLDASDQPIHIPDARCYSCRRGRGRCTEPKSIQLCRSEYAVRGGHVV